VWKSADCGASWTHLNTGVGTADIDNGSPWWIAVDPIDSDIVYTASGYGGNGIYKSTNGGIDWRDIRPLNPGVPTINFISSASIDPLDHNHLLLTFHSNCTGEFAPMCLGESKDGGSTWSLKKGPNSGWAEGGGALILGGDTWIQAAPQTPASYTHDAGKTWEQVVPSPGCYPTVIHATNGMFYMGCGQGVMQSSDGHAWTAIANSPLAIGLVEAGGKLFAGGQFAPTGKPYYSAPFQDPTTWTNIETPNISQGANYLGYDPVHHVLYGNDWAAGVWRVVTE